jgi:hypothetical protein
MFEQHQCLWNKVQLLKIYKDSIICQKEHWGRGGGKKKEKTHLWLSHKSWVTPSFPLTNWVGAPSVGLWDSHLWSRLMFSQIRSGFKIPWCCDSVLKVVTDTYLRFQYWAWATLGNFLPLFSLNRLYIFVKSDLNISSCIFLTESVYFYIWGSKELY